jgi:hypothetical protein
MEFMSLTNPVVSLERITMASSVTLPKNTASEIAELARQRPGVTRHRVGLALLDVALEIVKKNPSLLDIQLSSMVDAPKVGRQPVGAGSNRERKDLGR